MVELRLLGAVEAVVAGRQVDVGPPKQRVVLAALAADLGRPVSVETLIDRVWDADPPPEARKVIYSHVTRVRGLLGDAETVGRPGAVVVRRSGGYALCLEPDLVDAHRFRRLFDRARGAETTDADRAATLRPALALWRGPALAGVPGLWAARLRTLWERRRVDATRLWAETELRLGNPDPVATELRDLVPEFPLEETLVGLLMRALAAVGRTAEALELYRRTRDHLVAELGMEPTAALRRLQRQVLDADPALLEPRGGGPPPRTGSARPGIPVPEQLPADVPAFTGRVEHLRRLDRLRAAGALPAVVITGTAGVGKTALAVHWAHREHGSFPDGRLYVDLRGHAPTPPLSPVQALAQCLRALGVPAKEVPVEVDEAAATYRSRLAGRRALVLLDNARDPEQVRPLLPGSPGCLVLVTSRNALSGLVARDGARSLTLPVLTPDEARTLLARLLDVDEIAVPEDDAAELARLCARLPLALRIAAANIAVHPRRGIATYLAELRAADRLGALAVAGDELAAVRTAFDLSYSALPAGARRLYRLLGLVPGPDVTAAGAAALAGVPYRAATALLDTLTAAHLINEQAPGRYAFHDLLRCYARERASAVDAEDARERAVDRLHRLYLDRIDAAARLLYPQLLRLPPPAATTPATEDDFAAAFADEARALAWLDAERPNLIAAVVHAAAAGPRAAAWLLADGLRGYFWLRRYTVDWLGVAAAARTTARAAGEPQAEAAAELSLGLAHYSQCRLVRAAEHYTAALELSRGVGWLAGQASSLGNLGNVHADLGQLAKAAGYHTEALALNRAAGRPAQAANLDNLGAVHWAWGKPARAAEYYTDALAAHLAAGSRTGEAVALTNLGEARHALGRLAEARDALTRALRLCRSAGIRDGEADALDNLAAVDRDAGAHSRAADQAARAWALAQDIGDRRTQAEALNTLGSVEARQGRHHEALAHHRQALRIGRETGNRYTQTEALTWLAGVHRQLRRYAPALRHSGLAVAMARAGDFRLLHALALTELAAIRLARGEHELAVGMAERALVRHEAAGHRLGQARTLRILGDALGADDRTSARCRWEQALALYAAVGTPEADELRARLE